MIFIKLYIQTNFGSGNVLLESVYYVRMLGGGNNNADSADDADNADNADYVDSADEGGTVSYNKAIIEIII